MTALDQSLKEHSRPRLSDKVDLRMDPMTGQPVLLYPEGMLHLNESAHAILTLCDGKQTVDGLIAVLASLFECPADELKADVLACLHQLQRRQLLDLSES